MTHAHDKEFVLAVYPTSRGFAFVLFEGPGIPHDWGVRRITTTNKNAATLERITKLVERYEPDILVFEATNTKSRRSARIIRFYRMLAHYAATKHLTVFRYTRADIRACFVSVGATTKMEIAKAISIQIPDFTHRLPPTRKVWMSEDTRQSLFDAAALGIAHYAAMAKRERGERSAATGAAIPTVA